MRALLIILAVGALEIYLVSTLHTMMGIKDLLILYVGTTLFGFFLGLVNYGAFQKAKEKAQFSNKFRKRWKEGNLSKKDISNIHNAVYCTAYVAGIIFVAIPGVTTDMLGIALLLPPVGNFIGRHFTRNAYKYPLGAQ